MEPKIILLVDDNADDRELIRRAFRANGIWNEIVMAADGQQALNYLFGSATDRGPDPISHVQLVILDLNMPVMDGFEILRRMRADERTRDLPVVILTGSVSEQDRTFLEGLGITDFIRKPTDITEFLRVTTQLGLKWVLMREMIIFSGTATHDELFEALGAGADDYVLKSPPADRARLPSAVRTVLGRALTRRALRESEDRYRDLVEHSQDLICTHDLTGRIRSVNRATVKIVDYSEEQLLQMNIRDLLAPEWRAEFDVYLATIQTHGAASGLMQVQTATGERRILEYSNTLRTEDVPEPIVRSMAHDVTECRRKGRCGRAKSAIATFGGAHLCRGGRVGRPAVGPALSPRVVGGAGAGVHSGAGGEAF